MTVAVRTSLCLVVLNEYQGCLHDLPLIDFSAFDECFAIDGGSTDGTTDLLRQYGVTVYSQKIRSLNAAYWQAVEVATGENVIVFFPKATIDPSILQEIKQRLLAGSELVIPSRVMKGAHNEEDSGLFRPRKWGVQALAIIASLCWRSEGAMIWDVLHGVKGFNKRAFLQIAPSRTGLSVDLEMVIRAYRLRVARCEFPVHESERPWGTSRFKILPTGTRLARTLIRELLSPNSPVRQERQQNSKVP